jgi:UDP-N-acetylmuramyl pentapeptide phosphotransferase/UDP-N-acetylglucosamine-1-phosphate transferase
MNSIFENIDWHALVPALCGVLHYGLIRLFKTKAFVTSTNQVNAMGLGLVIGIVFLLQSKGFDVKYFTYGLVLLSMVNFIDDLFNVHFAWRLIAQFIACSFLLMEHGLFYSYWSPIMLVLIVGYINSFNFMDGINGHVGTYSLAVFAPFLLISDLDVESNYIIWAVLIFLLVFLVFNFRTKSLAWLGDTGSIALGYLSLHVFFNEFKNYQLYLFLVFALIFLIDSSFTMATRQLKGEDVFKRHQTHLYQLVTLNGKIKSYWWVFAVAFIQLAINVIVIRSTSIKVQAALSAGIAVIVFIAYWLTRKRVTKA